MVKFKVGKIYYFKDIHRNTSMVFEILDDPILSFGEKGIRYKKLYGDFIGNLLTKEKQPYFMNDSALYTLAYELENGELLKILYS
jgi:hypothetical protein